MYFRFFLLHSSSQDDYLKKNTHPNRIFMFSFRKSLIQTLRILYWTATFVMLQSCVSLTNISILWTLTWIVSKSRYDVCIMGSANDGRISMNNPQKAKKSFYCLVLAISSFAIFEYIDWVCCGSCYYVSCNVQTYIISPRSLYRY